MDFVKKIRVGNLVDKLKSWDSLSPAGRRRRSAAAPIFAMIRATR